jgi:Cu(I)-responsive transcriptional regulator
MRIGTVAERSGVPAKTIRYYEEVGLIEAADRTASGYRDYDHYDVETLRFIQRARSLGFSVNEVASLLALWRDRQRASAQVKKLASDHVARIDLKIAELQSMRDTLVDLIERCHGDHRPDCPILKDLAGESELV